MYDSSTPSNLAMSRIEYPMSSRSLYFKDKAINRVILGRIEEVSNSVRIISLTNKRLIAKSRKIDKICSFLIIEQFPARPSGGEFSTMLKGGRAVNQEIWALWILSNWFIIHVYLIIITDGGFFAFSLFRTFSDRYNGFGI